MTCRIRDLVDGRADLGYGVTIAPVFSDKKLVAVRLSHDIQDYGEMFGGVCEKILPLRGKSRRRRFTGPYQPRWTIRVAADGEVNLSPSVVCEEHGIHGFVRDGEWMPLREWAFPTWISEEEYARRIERAENEIREFGGGYEGAVLALASRGLQSRTRVML